MSACMMACLSCTPTGNVDDREQNDSISSQHQDDTTSLTILFTGDVLLDRGVAPFLEHKGIDYIFEEVSPMFLRADNVIINLECPLTDIEAPVNKKFIFRANPKWAKHLRRLGVTHVAMANNHTNDQGRDGLKDTYEHIVDAGIVPLGYGMNMDERLTPCIIEKGNIKVAVFNAVMFPLENWFQLDDRPDVCIPSSDILIETVRNYREEHPENFVVMVFHWGLEFKEQPTIMQRHIAHELADIGVNAIVGHHPHILQPIEQIDNTMVFYSLGNFVFDQHPPIANKTMIVELAFNADGTMKSDTTNIQIRQCKPCVI